MKKIMRAIIRSAGYEVRRISSNDQTIHFLHIGKNAGTQVNNIAKQINDLSQTRSVKKRHHDVFLKDLPSEADYFFSVRNPISRFSSGFYSRKRKGQPRIYSEWTPYDELSFSEFEHANDLAESLFEPGDEGRKAWAAMKSIRHTSQNQCDWFYCCGNFLRLRPPIWVIRQEKFEEDIKTFISKAFPELDISDINFGADDVKSHRNDYTDIPPLSEKAKHNLRIWYTQDFAFYDMCNAWIEHEGDFRTPV